MMRAYVANLSSANACGSSSAALSCPLINNGKCFIKVLLFIELCIFWRRWYADDFQGLAKFREDSWHACQIVHLKHGMSTVFKKFP